MVKFQLKHTAFLFLLIVSQFLFSQNHLRSEISINRNSVFVGQPVEVSVSVYTSTWFTAGVNPGNIKVNGAFTVYFRSLSNSKKINGKTYAGVTMYFHVFPYDDEDIEFPSLNIQVETPNTGNYKGIKHTIKTQTRTIKVKPVPPNMNEEEWLVTSWMSVSENWNGNLKNVKVGDVLERSILRNVSGTVSELIPPIIWDTISNVSLYPVRSTVKNNKTKTSISATRTEGVRYLFEKEGKITIPKMELTWWDPYRNKLYKKTLPKVEIDVQANPDLGMLTTIKETLEAEVIEEVKSEETTFNFLGLTLKEFIIYFCVIIVLLFILFRIAKRILNYLKRRRANYKISEKYYFDLFLKTVNSNNLTIKTASLYRWIDALDLEEPTVHFFAKTYGTKVLKNNHFNLSTKKQWKLSRENYLNIKNMKVINNPKIWINP